jgi:tRNA threonylcarbamoyl adenosine modification protein YjeE
MKEIISNSAINTDEIASSFANHLLPGDVIFLIGDLGSGKTVFTRSVIRKLTRNETIEVPSPTFTLVQTYDIEPTLQLWHFDLYRLEHAEDVYELGWEDAILNNILFVEWPDRLDYLAPEDRIDISFGLSEQKEERIITFEQKGTLKGRRVLDEF